MRPKRSKAEHNNLLTPHLNPIGSRPFTSPDLVLLYIPDSLCVLSYQDTDDGDTVGLRNVGRLKKKTEVAVSPRGYHCILSAQKLQDIHKTLHRFTQI